MFGIWDKRPARNAKYKLNILLILFLAIVGAAGDSVGEDVKAKSKEKLTGDLYLISNFHPASCGWLTDFDTERIYCANSYLDHLDRVDSDANYNFVMSEINNMIAIRNFQPERFKDLKKRVKEGRVELVNAFFLEPTICLSGGEALVKQGVEGIRWQKDMFGVKPKNCWMIDITGMHEQMAQIANGLGLESLVHCRLNISGSNIYWLQSPDGSRMLTIAPSHYAVADAIYTTDKPLTVEQIAELVDAIPKYFRGTQPAGLPYVLLGGHGDYSVAPVCADYPSGLFDSWNKAVPDLKLHFSTLTQYTQKILPTVNAGKAELPVVTGGWDSDRRFRSFWIEGMAVKQRFRAAEHKLQAAEAAAAIDSLENAKIYPSQDIYYAWLLLMLNMDRNSLWSAAAEVVFNHPTSWSVYDRYDKISELTDKVGLRCTANVCNDKEISLFNFANWVRKDPVILPLEKGITLKGAATQKLPNGQILCCPDMPSVGGRKFETEKSSAQINNIKLPKIIETKFFVANIDAKSGELSSLKLKSSGKELLAGPANVLVAEVPKKDNDFFHGMVERPRRNRVFDSSSQKADIKVSTGSLATVVEVKSKFIGGKTAKRVMMFYNDYPRIDFDVEIEDIPNRTVVVAEFPLAGNVKDARHGIPYGFSHGSCLKKKGSLNKYSRSIMPVVRWSSYEIDNGLTVALLDRGITGRELCGNTPLVYLLCTSDVYMGFPSSLLSGKGRHHFQYALVAGDKPWSQMRIPQMAWEYNTPLYAAGADLESGKSFIETSDNVIVEAIRRQGNEIEIRIVECHGIAGNADITVNLPHRSAALTNLLGENHQPLKGGPTYRFTIQPQQIITMRLSTEAAVPAVKTLTEWTELVPDYKRAGLNRYVSGVKGHPPREQLHPLPPNSGNVVTAGANGAFSLTADSAVFLGTSPGYDKENNSIGWWNNPADAVQWLCETNKTGDYEVQAIYGCLNGKGSSSFSVSIGDSSLYGKTKSTGKWTDYKAETIGKINVDKAGKFILTIEPKTEWKSWSLQKIILKPL